MVSRMRLARVVAVVVGLVMVGAVGAQVVQSGYTHHVEHIGSAEAAPNGETTFQYENLSTAGQDLMQRAFRAEGNTVTVGAEERPPEFRYGDGQIAHYVRFNGQAYRVTTGDRGPAALLGGPVGYAVLVVGLAAVALGGYGLYREETAAGPSVGGD
ncbi:MAG: hypothetical protein V5A44_11365 [Haloarculaceae archaeon]